MLRSLRFQKTYDLKKAQLIGQGNFAQVYKVFNEDMKKYIAVRRVARSSSDPTDVEKERLINQQLSRCHSPYILEIYQILDEEGCIYYLTEYCADINPRRHALNKIKDHRFNENQALQCVLQIARGVQQLHNQRITHRDLKPQNILLVTPYSRGGPFPSLKIADFGLSTKSIIMQTIAGTKQYLAPQQAKFHTYTNAVDVWSLGIILDELLHGQPFYTGADNQQVFDKLTKVDYYVRDQKVSSQVKSLLCSIIRKKAYQRPIIASIISGVQQILNSHEIQKGIQANQLKQQKLQLRPRSINSKNQKSILTKSQNRLFSQHQCTEKQQKQEATIPIYKMVKSRININANKKKSNESKQYTTPQNLVLTIKQQQIQCMNISQLSLNRNIQFNPNISLSQIEYKNPLLSIFNEQKKQFQYLNELRNDQGYQIKLKQTQQKLTKCKKQLVKTNQTTLQQLKQALLAQIDSYLQQFLNKVII